MAYGLLPNLQRSSADFPAALLVADRLAALPPTATAAQAGAILPGAENFDEDTAIYLLLGGATRGGGLAGTLSLSVGRGLVGVIEAAAYLMGSNTGTGPGPGIAPV
jgi:hypothetical protein